MKRIILIIGFLFVVQLVQAQTQTTPSSVPKPKAKPEFIKVTPTTFETSLAQGKLTLLKVYRKDANGSPLPDIYRIVSYTDPALLNNGKPVDISLTQQSFESVFTSSTTLTAKLPSLHKFISDKNISLADEKGWASVIKYFNTLN